MTALADEPSPPRPPVTTAEGIKLVGGLVVVCVGLLVLLGIAITALFLVGQDDAVAVATAAFGVIGSVVGAYFGVKIGTDGTAQAVAGLRDEAAKAEAFAAHVPDGKAPGAIADAQRLSSGSPSAAVRGGAGAPPPGPVTTPR